MPLVSELEVDCITINPFLRPDSLEPFIACARKYGKGLFILVKTSNPGATWLQDRFIDGASISEYIVDLVTSLSGDCIGSSCINCIGAVVGAIYPDDGQRLRMPRSIFLVPGIGAQGGAAGNISVMRRADGGEVLVPVSRGITPPTDDALSMGAYGALIFNRIRDLKRSVQ